MSDFITSSSEANNKEINHENLKLHLDTKTIFENKGFRSIFDKYHDQIQHYISELGLIEIGKSKIII